MSSELPILARNCRDEIAALYRFFEQWFHGELPNDAASMAFLEKVFAPEFSLISPRGVIAERAMIIDDIRAAHGRLPNITIWTDQYKLIYLAEDTIFMRYNEWQRQGESTLGRVVTALFRRDAAAPNDVCWLHIQETWLPNHGPDTPSQTAPRSAS